ncbi:MAG: HypC/HybG/HupF family hydrogenase formation chaperone [Lacunisphaera sp.]|nr:HypC/HybG/HupF family hydrogenase formation chaperone [Lacunisphaera sp.]
MCLAVPGKVVEIIGDDPLLRSAKVSFAGVIKLVSLTCTPEAKLGDYVLVHVGVAISTIDPQDAELTFRYLREMGELDGIDLPPEDPVGAVAPNGPGRLGASAPTPPPTPAAP